jgi:hypothetical protein
MVNTAVTRPRRRLLPLSENAQLVCAMPIERAQYVSVLYPAG